MSECEMMEYDVIVVGVGFVGLFFVICFKQFQFDIFICVIEKVLIIGVQIFFGVVIEIGLFDVLLFDWWKNLLLICVDVKEDEFWLFSKIGGCKLLVLLGMNNYGNVIVLLGVMCVWFVLQVEVLGVDVFFGFVVVDIIYNEDGLVVGVCIGDMGVVKDGIYKIGYIQGIDIKVKVIVLVEGVCGSFIKQLIKCFVLDKNSDLQGYFIGIKELWQLLVGCVFLGKIVYSFGWFVDMCIYGGSFFYYLDGDCVVLGYVSGLDYVDLNYQLWEVFQQWKNYLMMKFLFEGGIIFLVGVCVIVIGGYQLLLKIEMFGVLLIGDIVGLFNVFKIKGMYQVICSGMFVVEYLVVNDFKFVGFDVKLCSLEVMVELKKVCNIKFVFKKGLWFGMFNVVWEIVIGGVLLWMLKNKVDWLLLYKFGEQEELKCDYV